MNTMMTKTSAIPQVFVTWTQDKLTKKREIPFSVQQFTEKQSAYIEKQPKKSFLKSLLIDDLKLVSQRVAKKEMVYTFTSTLANSLFVIKENLTTKEKVLYQDEFILNANSFLCETFLHKLLPA